LSSDTRLSVFLRDRETDGATRAVLFGNIAPIALGFVTPVERADEALRTIDDFTKIERVVFAADNPKSRI
jgi:hypothetical protein